MIRALSSIILSFLIAAPASAQVGDVDFFETRIRPVLHERCLECHSGDEQNGGLRLDSREAMLRGGDSGAALIPGKPEESLLLKVIRHEVADLEMPPAEAGSKLSESTVEDFAVWVKNGAAWPEEAAPAGANSKESFDLAERKKRLSWIWRTPEQQAVPNVPNAAGLSDIDRFIVAKLREKGLQLSPPADDLTWLRRVHFVITGLPPTREQIQTFLNDASSDRRERTVDTLLASPHFGERWARHWMDLMRYAESRGHESDFSIANAWQYRDYLIRTLNADLPYDRFVTEHLAGDLVEARLNPATGGNEAVLATGWAFLGEEVHSPVDIRQDECERIDNKIDVLSKTFLGLTVACARCHDHKFDAISQQDYYSLSGLMLGSTFRQVRFETMAAHAQAAMSLEQFRAQSTAKTAQAFAESARPGLRKIATYLAGACRVLSGENGESVATEMQLDAERLESWVKRLELAKNDPSNPLRLFQELASDSSPIAKEKIASALSRFRNSKNAALSEATIRADFTRSSSGTPWKSDGPGFGTRPLRPGELIFGTEEQPIARVMPYGAAVRDSFWKGLTLTPGTEMDSGRLVAAGRSGKTLLAPKFTLGSGQLHYLVRGKSQVYACVDSHIMNEGPLHEAFIANLDSGGQLRWLSHNLSAYAGHRVSLEFAPLGDSDLEVLMVVESPELPPWLPVQPWTPENDPADLLAVANEFESDCVKAINELESGKANGDSRYFVLADWLVQNHSLLGLDLAPVRIAAADYFRVQTEIAKSIRWASPTAVSLADVSGVDENVLLRGKPTRPGPIAPRGLPVAFETPRITATECSGRAELARQLVDPSNPLVARVMVNRVWHHLFGRGIVSTVDNFGYLGEPPSHPELLDHLAWQFVHQYSWSLKQLIRSIVLSQTFAQGSLASSVNASEIDPSNALLHRMPVRRLESEAIRDAMLVVSGRFDPKTYGPPVPVHLTEFIIGRGRPEVSGPLDGAGRRSIYTATRRNFLPTMMLAFDFPTPFSTVGRRNVTNVPAQSLTMMNDPFVREQAGVWAAKLLNELPAAEQSTRIAALFEAAYCRPPSADELRFSAETLDELRAQMTGEPESALWAEFCHALFAANDFIYLK
jgi:hypothetical protein